MRIHKIWLPVLAMLIFLLCVGLRMLHRFGSPNLTLTFFDVGQGDAALVQFPYGKTLLIDAGGGFGEFNLGTRELFPELARAGILRLDAAILSHPDNDHAYGFLGLLQNLSIGQMWLETRYTDSTAPPLLRKIESEAVRNKVTLFNIQKPQKQTWGTADLELYPVDLAGKRTNSHMLVLLIRFAGCTALYPGDLEKEGERALIQSLPSLDILKVAHHGSRTSSTEAFLKVAKPKIAVVSVGLENRYGHPNTQALSRLFRNGAQILRTDFHGFIRLTLTPNGKIFCETSHGYCGETTCLSPSRVAHPF